MKVIVEIQDLNDNRPVFKDKIFHLEINEATKVNTAFLLPFADDSDSPSNGVLNYTLISNSDHFRLVTTNLLTEKGFEEVKLVLVKSLDREVKDEYQLKLLAFDEAFEPGELEVSF